MISIPNFPIASLLSVIIFIFFFQKWLTRTASTPRQRLLPPSPTKLPLIGNLHQLAREIMKNQDMIFASRPILSTADKLFYGLRDVAFAPYGEYWRNARGISISQLLSKKRVQSFRRAREEETSLMVERIRKLGSSSQAVNLSDALSSLTNDLISRATLGRKYSDSGKLFNALLKELMELLVAPSIRDYIPWLGWIDRVSGLDSRVDRLVKGFDEFLNVAIEEHRRNRTKGEEEKDFLDLLIDHQTLQKENSHTLLDDDSLKALILEMFAAGTHTTSTALVWTMAELIKDPKTMKKLQREVREISRTNANEITEDDLDKMQYLKAAIKESFRLHPPLPLLVPRESTQDTKVFGYDIPKGTQVAVNAWAIYSFDLEKSRRIYSREIFGE